MSGKDQRKLHQILDDIVAPEMSAQRHLLLTEFITCPQVAQYNLQPLDALVVAYAWQVQRNEKDCPLTADALQIIVERPNWSLAELLRYTATLIDRCILNTVDPLEADYRKFPVQLLKESFRLSSSFSYLIMELKPGELIRDLLDYSPHSEKQLAEMTNYAFDLIKRYYWEAEHKLLEQIDFTYPDYYLDCIEPLINLLRFGLDNPLSRGMRKAQLSKKEAGIIVYLLHRFFNDLDGMDGDDLVRLVSRSTAEENRNSALLDEDSKLLRSGLVRVENGDFWLGRGLVSYQNPLDGIFCDLRREPEGSDESLEREQNPALRNMPCPRDLDSLILPDKDMALLRGALRRFQNGDFQELKNWGLNPTTQGQVSKNNGLTVLFYGEPGTGKTFAAGAVAAELEKELLGIDATQLRNHWYGDSEKIVRRIFEDMSRIVGESGNPPVFLLNECDQIIHRRDASPIGSENTENAIQNVFLEQLETFPGILILTTNLIDNIDDAYFRRFNIKIQFTRPDEACRLRLWKAHLLPTIPGAQEIPVEDLARDYGFTGGQISLVVQNACFEAVSREGAERCLKLEDILKYANIEQPWNGKGQKRPVGF